MKLVYGNSDIFFHYVKSVRIRSFSGPYFPAFGLNTERYGVSLRIQSECGKIRTRKTPRKIRTSKTPNTDTFHAVFVLNFLYFYSNLQPFSHCWWMWKCRGSQNGRQRNSFIGNIETILTKNLSRITNLSRCIFLLYSNDDPIAKSMVFTQSNTSYNFMLKYCITI